MKSLSLQNCLFIAVFRKPSWKDGTTATVVVVVNETVFIAWLGDSQVSQTDHDGMQLNTSYSHGVDSLYTIILLFWTFPNVLKKYNVIHCNMWHHHASIISWFQYIDTYMQKSLWKWTLNHVISIKPLNSFVFFQLDMMYNNYVWFVLA